MASVQTNPDYWDCECRENYIHRKTIPDCMICGARQEDQPDSLEEEVQAFLKNASGRAPEVSIQILNELAEALSRDPDFSSRIREAIEKADFARSPQTSQSRAGFFRVNTAWLLSMALALLLLIFGASLLLHRA